MKRLYLIVLGLWLLAACAFGQNGPTPPVYIDTDQIVDGAVTALKTDGTLMLSDGSNASDAAAVRGNLELGTMAVATATDYVATDTFTGHTDATGASVHGLGTISTKAATDYVATSSLAARVDTVNASFSGDIDVVGDVGAATVNGVAPLTADEKTQALVGSTTVAHTASGYTSANSYSPSAENTLYGSQRHSMYLGGITATGGTRKVKFTRPATGDYHYMFNLKMVGFITNVAGTISKNVTYSFGWKTDGTISGNASSSIDLGSGASDVAVTVVASGTTEIGITLTNNGGTLVGNAIGSIEIIGTRGGTLTYRGVE